MIFFVERQNGKTMFNFISLPAPGAVAFLFGLGAELSNFTLNHENVIKLMKSNEKFDLIITEAFCIDALIGFGQYYNAPVILVAPFGGTSLIDNVVGNPSPLSYIPHYLLSYTDSMSFSQRFHNGFLQIFELLMTNLYYIPSQRKIYDENFPNPKPDFNEIYKNDVSLVFLNSHFSLSFPRPYLPNVIEIGGIHINDTQNTLPQVSVEKKIYCKIFFYAVKIRIRSRKIRSLNGKKYIANERVRSQRIRWL